MNTLSSLLNWIGNTIGANPNTLTTTSKTLVGAINEVGTDYIVEQGTSGIWTYRKWNSGIAECWASQTKSNFAITRAWGSLYVGPVNDYFGANFPSGLFTNAPKLVAQVDSDTSASLLTAGNKNTTSIYTAEFTLVRGTSATGAFTVNFYAIGN